MFDVRVVFGRVRYNVVDVMVSLPPANRQAAQEIGNEDADACVNMEVMGNAHMPSIVGGKDELVPEDAKEGARKGVLAVLERDKTKRKEERVAGGFVGVSRVRAVIEALGTYSNIQSAIFLHNSVLR